jgi:hypothetical protein
MCWRIWVYSEGHVIAFLLGDIRPEPRARTRLFGLFGGILGDGPEWGIERKHDFSDSRLATHGG